MLPALDETPLVSVMTIAHNHERFVAEAIESVLAQDWPADRLEYVVVDDGSTDGTREAIEPYRDRVRIIHQPNLGLRAAVDRAMSELHGDVITAVAGDDAFKPGRLRLQVEALRAHPTAGLVYTDEELIDADGRVLHPSFMQAYGHVGRSGRIQGALLVDNFVSGGGIMLRGCLKHLYHPIPEHAAWEDYWWAWAVSSVADVVYVPVATYRYRQHGANLSLGITGERLRRAQREELRFRRWMLGTIRPGRATTAELAAAVQRFSELLAEVARELGLARDEVLPVTDDDHVAGARLAAESATALAEGDVAGAALLCARALARDPSSATPVELAAQILQPVRDGRHRDLETRDVVVLADADELLAEPELLAAYAEVAGPDDDVTLVIHGDGWSRERLAAELPPLLARVGLDGDDSPDMLALADVPGGRAALRRRADAALGVRAAVDGTPAPHPVHAVGELARLLRRDPLGVAA